MSGRSSNRWSSGWPFALSHGQMLFLIAGGLLVMVAVAAGLVVFTAERLHHEDAPKSIEQLAQCLGDNDSPNLTVQGEALIEHACREWVRDRPPEAACVLRRHATMTGDDATRAVEKACGVEPPSL